MNNKELDLKFEQTYEQIRITKRVFPVDVMLRLYAYYKQATGQTHVSSDFQLLENNPLVKSFKINALLQVANLSREEAKRLYISYVDKLLK